MTKLKQSILTAVFTLVGIAQMVAQGFSFDSGSDGSYGVLDVTVDETIPLPADGIINATTINVAQGATLTFTPNEFNTPVYLLATGAVNIAGIIDVQGSVGTSVVGGQGGPGGFAGGNPGSFGVDPGDGFGPGGGIAGTLSNDADGAGSGSYGNQGSQGSSAGRGAPYGSALLIPMIGGSGGGGAEGAPGVGGSGGGGAILIASNEEIQIEATGRIDANGGRTPNSSSRQAGSGGAIRLVAPKVSGSGVVSCETRWTSGGPSGNNYAGVGRIRVDAIDRTEMNLQFNPLAFTSVGANLVVFPAPLPRLDITEVAGTNVALDTTNSVFVDLPFNADPNRTVTVRAQDFGKVVNIAVVLQPVNGDRIIYEDSIDNSGSNPATKAINVVFPVNTQTKVFVWTRPDS